MLIAALTLLAYFVGGIPFAVPVVRLFNGADVRTSGSGNVGARNSLRVAGPAAGVLVLLLDACKAAAMALLARALSPSPWAPALAALAAVVGHCFSPYMLPALLRGRWPGWRAASLLSGGVGLASGLGAFLVLAPLPVLPVLAIGAFIMFVLKRPSEAGAAVALLGPLAVALLGYPVPVLSAMAAMGA
ncbi:MAG TPA: glycerol-3-phosphate acyltransferase, partial [Herpetosiphonaceae bacterium]